MTNQELVEKVCTLINMRRTLTWVREDAKRVGFGHEVDDHIYTLIEFVEFELDELDIEYDN